MCTGKGTYCIVWWREDNEDISATRFPSGIRSISPWYWLCAVQKTPAWHCDVRGFSSWNTTYLNWDDETCCANSVGAWYADLVNRTALESGKLKKAFYDKKYVIAGWSIFSLMLAVLTDIYPAVIYRMLLPMIKIPLTYSIFYRMINNLFMQQTKTLLSVIIIQALILQTEELSAETSSEWWFLVNAWSGKALSFNVMVSLILWLIFEIEDCDKEGMRKKTFGGSICSLFCLLLNCSFAACDNSHNFSALGRTVLNSDKKMERYYKCMCVRNSCSSVRIARVTLP